MTADGDDLFTGRDDGPEWFEQAAAPNADQAPLAADDYIDPREFLADLTYGEVHAFVWGFAPFVLGLALDSGPLLALGVGVVTAALLGRRVGRFVRVPRYILGESHYTLGGAVLALPVGGVVDGLVDLTGWLLPVVGGLV